MRGIRMFALATLIAGMIGVTLPYSTEAARTQSCLRQRATIVAVAGAVTNGTPGDDVIAGSPGNDIIYGNGGNDLICGRAGHDVIYAYAPEVAADVDLVDCADSIDLEAPYVTRIVGDSGNDVICGPSSTGGGYWSANGGSGSDIVGRALGVDEDIDGGSGNDTVYGALKYPGNLNSFSNAYGGSGHDRVSAGEMFFAEGITPTPYGVLADGGSGADEIFGAAVPSLNGLLKGGSGIDTCTMVGTAVGLAFHASCETQIV